MSHMRIPLQLVAAVAVFALPQLAHSDILTSYTDDFNRDELGDNWTTIGSTSFIIVDGVVTNLGGGSGQLNLNLGTLPTATDFANGYSWTASVDLYAANPNPVTFGLLVNAGTQSAQNLYALRYRGNNADGTQTAVQAYYRNNLQQESVSQQGALFTATLDTWYTLTVTATAPYEYVYSIGIRGEDPVVTGTLNQSGSFQLSGGYIGLFTDNGSGYQLDNFSVTVNAPVPEPATVGLVLGSAGLVGFILRSRRRRS